MRPIVVLLCFPLFGRHLGPFWVLEPKFTLSILTPKMAPSTLQRHYVLKEDVKCWREEYYKIGATKPNGQMAPFSRMYRKGGGGVHEWNGAIYAFDVCSLPIWKYFSCQMWTFSLQSVVLLECRHGAFSGVAKDNGEFGLQDPKTAQIPTRRRENTTRQQLASSHRLASNQLDNSAKGQMVPFSLGHVHTRGVSKGAGFPIWTCPSRFVLLNPDFGHV